jgi:hypothetical protein
VNAPAKLSKVEQLRARDGERCWLCDGKLDFAAAPNSKKAPTIEHLVAQANGGTNALDNLVLTHPGCNKQLGCRPREDKLKMRERRQRNREQIQAAGRVRADTPVEEGGNKGKPPVRASTMVADRRGTGLRLALRRWQVAAYAAASAALLMFGFAVGVLAGR